MPDTIPTQIDTSQQRDSAAQGNQILLQLVKQRDGLQKVATQAAQEASIPVSASSTTSPQLSLPQVKQFQPQPMNDRQVVGSKAARYQGIGNLITATTNVIGKYQQQKSQEKQRVLAVDIERVLQANDGINQAEQVLKNDPNNVEAKQTLIKNQGVINAMLQDDKKRKELAKAFDISFTDPSRNNQPEHQAMKQAVTDYSKQFRSQMPQQMVPNQAAIDKAKMAQASLKSLNDAVNAVVPLAVEEGRQISQDQKDVAAQKRLETKDADELARQDQKDKDKAKEDDKRLSELIKVAQIGFEKTIKAAQISGNARIQTATIAAGARVKAVKMALDAAELKVTKNGYKGQQAATELQKSLNELDKKAAQIPDEIIKYNLIITTSKDPSEVAAAQAYVNTLISTQKIFDEERRQRQDQIDAAIKQETNGQPNNSTTSGANSGKQNSLNTGQFATGAAAVNSLLDDKPEEPDLNPKNYQ